MINKINYDLIKAPVITEKSTFLGEKAKYTFHVARTANKQTIKDAVESIFTVKVVDIAIINQKGKIKKFKGRLGKRSDVKKAIVTISKDQTIDLTGGGNN